MPLDETVVADIYRDHAAVLRRFLGRPAINPARAEDVVQEVIPRVWRRAPEVTSMGAYLMQTARNMLIDMHRAAGRWVIKVAADRDDHSRAPRPAHPQPEVEIDRALDQIPRPDPSTRSLDQIPRPDPSSTRLWPGSDRTIGRSWSPSTTAAQDGGHRIALLPRVRPPPSSSDCRQRQVAALHAA